MSERPDSLPDTEPQARLKAAVALEYSPHTHAAPHVTATGTGWLAERIVEEARRAGVPIREDRDLVSALAQLDLGRDIPADLYVAVAEILFCLYRANEAWKAAHGVATAPSSGHHPANR